MNGLQTLETRDSIGDSILGKARVGARHPSVEIGKMAPMFRKSEEPEGLVRCTFLDPTVPIEVNLLHWQKIRRVMQRLAILAPTEPDWLNPNDIIRGRPSVAFVPPDALTEVTPNGIKALTDTGAVGTRVSQLRGRNSNADAAFWNAVASTGLYTAWLDELRGHALAMGTGLMAPPVPVVHGDLDTSPDGQHTVNLAAANHWRSLVKMAAAPGGNLIEEYLRQRQIGLLYSLHVHPSALRSGAILQRSLRLLSSALTTGDNPFWGVHINLFDMGLASRQNRPGPAKEFIREAARIARDANVFAWASDVGPVGPAILDLGVAFASYHSGVTPGRVYGPDGGPGDKDLQYGKVIELWKYGLYDHSYVEAQAWTLEDTALFPNVVPMGLRNTTPMKWRVGFSRPHNTAVAERLNALRQQDLVKGNLNPGKAHVGKSSDDRIAPWAA